MSAATEQAIINASSAVASASGKVATTASDILQTYLVKALDATGNMVDKAVDMVQTQAPILVNEVLHWYFAYYLIQFIAGLVIIGLGVYVSKRVVNWFHSDGISDGMEYAVGAMIIAVSTLIAFSLINLTWLKIYIAPRLWLIEYTADLIKHGVH